MSLFPKHPDELDAKEFERVAEILADAEENGDELTEWEQGFCEDLRERFVQYGKRTRISERQMEIVDRIGNKLYG